MEPLPPIMEPFPSIIDPSALLPPFMVEDSDEILIEEPEELLEGDEEEISIEEPATDEDSSPNTLVHATSKQMMAPDLSILRLSLELCG